LERKLKKIVSPNLSEKNNKTLHGFWNGYCYFVIRPGGVAQRPLQHFGSDHAGSLLKIVIKK
jgi:hypothetical protein